jgi:hypothetical protein
MPQDYYSLVTNNGLIKEAQAGQIGGSPINLTEIAVGDGGGSSYDPNSSATALVNELYRTALTSSVLDANNPNQLIIEGVIPEEAGPFYIREVGIFDSEGDLFAIGKYPETFKSNYTSGSGKRLYIRMIIGFVSTPNVEIMISENINFDPNFEANLNAELANINNELSDRLKISENLADLNDAEAARENLGLGSAAIAGDASEEEKGIAQIANQSEVDLGLDDEKFITPLKYMSGFNNSKASSGYTYLPNGLILQWAGFNSTVDGSESFNFPIAFPNAIFAAFTNSGSVSATNDYKIVSITTTQITVDRSDTIDGSRLFYVYAIGN